MLRLTGPTPTPPATILFAKHRGRTYPQAVATARQAWVYREQGEGAAFHHVATLARTAAQASAVLHFTVNLTGAACSTVTARWIRTRGRPAR